MSEPGDWTPIPGETPIDPSGLKVKSVRTRRELNIVESQNVLKATGKYLLAKPNSRTAPFSYAWALRLHREMFGDVWRWAGSLRQSVLTIGCQPHLIAERLAHLLSDLKSWTAHGTPFSEQAAWLHHRAVEIHPFENGNGRWSRLLANIWLRRGDEPPIEWPDATIGAESTIRGEYLAALRAADQGDYAPLIALQQRYIRRD